MRLILGLCVILATAALVHAEELKLSFEGSNTNPPTFSGLTNLPDGTFVSVTVRGDPPGCRPYCGFIVGENVKRGRFDVLLKVDSPNGRLVDGGYTVDVHTSDSTGRIYNRFLDPTDDQRMFRFTTRLDVRGGTSSIDQKESRLLPFRGDEKYFHDEYKYGREPRF